MAPCAGATFVLRFFGGIMHKLILLVTVAALAAPVAAATIDVGPQTSTFTGNTRGYWFTAPVDFYITGFFVPTDSSSDSQDIAVMRFNSAIPTFSATTNDFTTLRLIRDDASLGFVAAAIQFRAGDIVGLLGSRGVSATNSYGAGGFATTLGGNAITLQRMGMQSQMRATDPGNIWTEGGSISRVLFTYELGEPAPGVPEPASWAMLIAGFSLTGAAMRRRRAVAA